MHAKEQKGIKIIFRSFRKKGSHFIQRVVERVYWLLACIIIITMTETLLLLVLLSSTASALLLLLPFHTLLPLSLIVASFSKSLIFQIAASVPVHWQCLVFDHLMNKNHLQRFDSSGHSTIQHKWTDQFISDKDINSFYIFIEYKLRQKRRQN